MFKLNEKYENNRKILNCDYKRYSPSEVRTRDAAYSQIHINITREDSAVSLLHSYLDEIFDVLHAATKKRYTNGDIIK